MSRRQKRRWFEPALHHSARTAGRAEPTISQRETIVGLNERLGSSYEVPDTELDANFLIDGMRDEERRMKRDRHV